MNAFTISSSLSIVENEKFYRAIHIVRKICELLLKKYCKPGKLLKNGKK